MKPHAAAARMWPPSPSAVPHAPRLATRADVPELLRLELACFEAWRRDSPRVIRGSIGHPKREIWAVETEAPGTLSASITLRRLPHALRVSSLGTDPAAQGRGLGAALLNVAFARAEAWGVPRLTLEAATCRPKVVTWYEKHGFVRARRMKDYYAARRDAWLMVAVV